MGPLGLLIETTVECIELSDVKFFLFLSVYNFINSFFFFNYRKFHGLPAIARKIKVFPSCISYDRVQGYDFVL